MGHIIGIISEVVVLVFNILIYTQLTVLKKDCRRSRLIMYGGCAVILAAFVFCTYKKILPEALASFVLVTLPSFILFFILSKYKDFRFFVTFCFLDTVTLIITFFSRAITIAVGGIAGIVSAVVVCLLMFGIYIFGRPVFSKYRNLMENVNDGWEVMALSTFLVYLLLIFTASYPKPLVERAEYLPVYAFLSVTIFSFYAVFILSMTQKKKLADLNTRLINEKKWYKIAYNDALTGLKNRMAYVEYVNELERTAEKQDVIYLVMIDINNFKKINDTFGHHIGDQTLQNVANFFETVFSEENYVIFRIGGDEFVIVAADVGPEELERKIVSVKKSKIGVDIGYSFSVGYAAVDFEQKNGMETALIRADRAMYEDKMKNKAVV